MSVFISYRRAESEVFAQRLYDVLSTGLGDAQVFMDKNTLQMGQNFDERLRRGTQVCDAALVLIGPQWLKILRERAKKDEQDYVRLEVELLLAREKCRVVPVLLDGASLPNGRQLPVPLRKLSKLTPFVIDPENTSQGIKELREQMDTGLFGRLRKKSGEVLRIFDSTMDTHKYYLLAHPQDASDQAGRLAEAMRKQAGKDCIVKVYGSLTAPEAESEPHIRGTMDSADLVFILIGPRWAEFFADESPLSRRWKQELRISFSDRKTVYEWEASDMGLGGEREEYSKRKVIPILLEGAAMPSAQRLPAEFQSIPKWQARRVRANNASLLAKDVTDLVGDLRKQHPLASLLDLIALVYLILCAIASCPAFLLVGVTGGVSLYIVIGAYMFGFFMKWVFEKIKARYLTSVWHR